MQKNVIGRLVLASALLAGASARAQDGLDKAFSDAREAIVEFHASVAAARPDAVVRTSSFIPNGCSVESWCLVKATDCFLGQITQPTGLWQAHAQYSVVRRAVALCPDG